MDAITHDPYWKWLRWPVFMLWHLYIFSYFAAPEACLRVLRWAVLVSLLYHIGLPRCGLKNLEHFGMDLFFSPHILLWIQNEFAYFYGGMTEQACRVLALLVACHIILDVTRLEFVRIKGRSPELLQKSVKLLDEVRWLVDVNSVWLPVYEFPVTNAILRILYYAFMIELVKMRFFTYCGYRRAFICSEQVVYSLISLLTPERFKFVYCRNVRMYIDKVVRKHQRRTINSDAPKASPP